MRQIKISFLVILFVFVFGCGLHYYRGYYNISVPPVHGWGADDAYITYRYGWNLANNGNLSWNESGYRRVEGFTNPLWVYLSATWALMNNKDLLYPLSTLTSVVISSILLGLLIWAVFLENKRVRVSVMGIGMVSALPVVWSHTTSGLESGVFGIGLAVVAYLALMMETRKWTGLIVILLTSLLCLIRSDGFVYLLPILVGALIVKSTQWWNIGISAFLTELLLIIWRYCHFQTLSPNTAVAKLNFSFLERIPVGFELFLLMLVGSGMLFYLLIGIGGLWRENKKKRLAGLFIVLFWVAYYVFIGGDHFYERHLIGLYFLLAAFSGPFLLRIPSRLRFIIVFIIPIAIIISNVKADPRFAYIHPKVRDPWIILGKTIAEDRDRFGVIVIGAAGKIPFYAGGDFIDSLGLNDPELAKEKRDIFVPGHSAGSDAVALSLAQSYPNGKYSVFSFIDINVMNHPEDIVLWIDNFQPQATPKTSFTPDEWDRARFTENPLIWSIISTPNHKAVLPGDISP